MPQRHEEKELNTQTRPIKRSSSLKWTLMATIDYQTRATLHSPKLPRYAM